MTSKSNASYSEQTPAFSSQESSLTSSTKYGGLITISFTKQIRNALVVLSTHFDQTVPFRFLMHNIVAAFRFIQLIFPAFLLNDHLLFTKGTVAQTTTQYLSILYRFVPIGMSTQKLNYALDFYFAIAALFDIVFLISGLVYRETAKISDFISNVLSISISVLGHLLQPFGASLFGEIIGALIFDKYDNMFGPIMACSFSVLVAVFYFMLESYVFVHSIMFKPDSVPFVSGFNALYFSLIILFINLTYSFATRCTLIPKLIFLFIGIIEYIIAIIFVPRGASFVKFSQCKLFVGLCMSGIIATLVNMVLLILGIKGDMIVIIVYIGIVLIGVFTSQTLVNKYLSKSLIFLDEIADNPEGSLENVGITKFVQHCVVGCYTGHSQCASFKVFEKGLEQWPNAIELILVYAKFIAIYPECTKKLEIMLGRLRIHGMKSMAAKQYMHQILSIIDQRENVVSPSLKKKMNQAQKKINTAKRKVQNIWDYIIQSNFQELGPAVNSGYTAVNNAESDLTKLRNAFPNNSFVSRIYLRFMLDIRHDLTKVNAEYDKIAKLRKGILVVLDRASELGTIQFPHMPTNVSSQSIERIQTMESVTETEIGLEEDNSEAEIEANKVLMEKISKMNLPAINKTISLFIILTIIFVVLPIAILMAMNSTYVNSVLQPIGYMKAVSLMRSLSFQVSSSIIRIALEELPDIKMVTKYPDGYYPENFGKSRVTREQMTVFIAKIGTSTSDANEIRDYMIGNEEMDHARKILFTKEIDYKYYKNTVEYENVKMSGVNILLDIAMLGSRVISTPVLDESFISTVEFMNPRMNCEEAGKRLSEVMTIFVDYVRNQCQTVKQLIMFLQIIYSVIVSVLYIVIIWYSIKHVQTETNEVYISLTLLPKAAVSHAADSIRILRKDTTTSNNTSSSGIENSNKQEETIIKVFMSANENSSGNTVMNAIEIVATVIIIATGLIAINVLASLYSQQYDIFQISAPHCNYIMGASAYIYASILSLNTIALQQSYPKFDVDVTIHVPRFNERIGLFRNFYNAMRYGGSSSLESPFVGFEKGVESANEMLMCPDITVAPTDFEYAYSCYDIETQFILFAILSRRVAEPYIANTINNNFQGTLDRNYDLTTENEYLNSLWTLGPIVIYDTFVCPLITVIDESIRTEMEDTMMLPLITAGVMIFIVIIMLVTIIIVNKEIMKRVRFFFSLILHINAATVLSTNKIMSILNGEVLGSNIDTSLRNDGFYDEVVQKHINGIIAADESKKIVSVNQMIVNNFKTSEEELIGQDLSCFFNKERFDKVETFFNGTKCVEEATLNHNGTYYKCISKPAKTTLIIILKDITTKINHEKLISEERAKSDMMLSSILPPALVPRVQSGETNISFAVQSASVLFLDIVSFTPWCGSNKATYVMKVLNMLFKYLDAELKEFPTMTKIKCIGDCYMAAGGVFDEVNQPAVHAKQCVEFGLKAIQVVEKLDAELNEKLQIRVGINSGGPLVAGVIGTGKPTFEIIGPCINMAQQMEHHGVPMQVHISRSTYELIYGGSFNIKERGIVEVKNGKVNTYLVSN